MPRNNLGVDSASSLLDTTEFFNESLPNCDHDNILNQIQYQSTHCIFCGIECPAKFVIVEGELIKVKCEGEKRHSHHPHVVSGDADEDNLVLKRQLKALFILRKILGVEKDICYRLLTQLDGQLNPEYWLNVCDQCDLVVANYKKNQKKIGDLERQGRDIQFNLKKIIWKSRHDDGDGNGERDFSGIWKELREKALLDFDPSQIQPESSSSVDPHRVCVKLEKGDDLNSMMSLIIIVSLLLDNDQDQGQQADSIPGSLESPSPSLSQSQPLPPTPHAQAPPPEATASTNAPEEPGERAEIMVHPETAITEGILAPVYCEVDSAPENPTATAQDKNIPKPPSTPVSAINITKLKKTLKKTGPKTKDKLLKCKLCPAKFPKGYKALYVDHSKLHEEGGPGVMCSHCNVFVHGSTLDLHQRSYKCLKRLRKRILESFSNRAKSFARNKQNSSDSEPLSTPTPSVVVIEDGGHGQPVPVEVVDLCNPLGRNKTSQNLDDSGELEFVEVVDLEESERRESQSSKNSLAKGATSSQADKEGLAILSQSISSSSQSQSQSEGIEILDEYIEQEMDSECSLVDNQTKKSTASPQPSSSSSCILPKKKPAKKPSAQKVNTHSKRAELLKKKDLEEKDSSKSKENEPSTSKAATKTARASWSFDSESGSDSNSKSSTEWNWELNKDGTYTCPRCPATIQNVKSQLRDHRALHDKGGPGWPCPCCSIYAHKSRIVLHQRGGKCLNPPPDDSPLPPPIIFFQQPASVPKGNLEERRKKGEQAPEGFVKVTGFTVAGAPIYKCKQCPARMKLEAAKAHQCPCGPKKVQDLEAKNSPAESKSGKKFPCKFCGLPFLSEDKDEHERTQCSSRPGPANRGAPGPINKIRNEKTKEGLKDHYKCKDCSALFRNSAQIEKELKKHFEMHKKSGTRKISCLVCGWVVDNICLHNAEWHSENSIQSNDWALRPNFWVVDASNPKYILYKQEYITKYKCERCPAELFSEEEIVEHSKAHDENEGELCRSCTWLVAPGKMKEHEKKHHVPRRSDEHPASILDCKKTKYWSCFICEGKLLEDEKEEHITLHSSGDGSNCTVCGLLIKSEMLVHHLAYFHPELGFTTYI